MKHSSIWWLTAAGQLSDVIAFRISSKLSLEFATECTECQGLFKLGQGDAKEDEEGGEDGSNGCSAGTHGMITHMLLHPIFDKL